jgi:hypothetical protein
MYAAILRNFRIIAVQECCCNHTNTHTWSTHFKLCALGIRSERFLPN